MMTDNSSPEIFYPDDNDDRAGLLAILKYKGANAWLVYLSGFVIFFIGSIRVPLIYENWGSLIFTSLFKLVFFLGWVYSLIGLHQEVAVMGLDDEELLLKKWLEEGRYHFDDISNLKIERMGLGSPRITLRLKDSSQLQFRVTRRIGYDKKNEALDELLMRLKSEDKLRDKIVDER